jgi:general stress protein CsbA
MTHIRLARFILWTTIAILLMAFTAQYFTAAKYWLVFLDNIHWTTGNVCAAALAWIGFINGSGAERAARLRFFGISRFISDGILFPLHPIYFI